jgi:heme oxygenase (biliverdin-IX-beta and delta-forming)
MREKRETGLFRGDKENSEKSFLAVLKGSTQKQHTALEEARLSSDLMAPNLTRDRYLSILYGFYGAFHPLEEALASAPGFALDNLPPIRRTSLAAEDICYLAGRFDPSLPIRLPPPWSSVNDPVALGITYVLEGSRLGGKVISRHIHKIIRITPENGGSFFAGSDSPGMESWKTFKNRCEDYAEQFPSRQADIITAASEAFAYIRESFAAHDRNMIS